MLRHDNLDNSHAYQSGGKWIPQRIVLCESQSNNYCEHVFIIESFSLSTHVYSRYFAILGFTGDNSPTKKSPHCHHDCWRRADNNKSSLLLCQLATWIFKIQARSIMHLLIRHVHYKYLVICFTHLSLLHAVCSPFAAGCPHLSQRLARNKVKKTLANLDVPDTAAVGTKLPTG